MNTQISGISFAYPVRTGVSTKIFDGANATFSPGKFYAITGPSGSGKTTLFRLFSREISPAEGTILISGRNIDDIDKEDLRQKVIAQVFQDYRLVPYLSAGDNALLPLEIIHGKITPENRKKMDESFELLGISHLRDTQTHLLSGGEQQRVAIARALAVKPHLLLADEPTGALDANNTEHIGELLRQVSHEQNITVLCATHDSRLAKYTDAIFRIENYALRLQP